MNVAIQINLSRFAPLGSEVEHTNACQKPSTLSVRKSASPTTNVGCTASWTATELARLHAHVPS